MTSSLSDGDYLSLKDELFKHLTLRMHGTFSKCYYSTFRTLGIFSKLHHMTGRKHEIFYKQDYSKTRLSKNLSEH